MTRENTNIEAACSVSRKSVSTPMVERIEIWDIQRLIPSARNARTHSDAQVAEIAGSMAAFGFIVPVLVDANGVIIAGHGRVLAARKLKLERVPVIVADHLTDAEKRAPTRLRITRSRSMPVGTTNS